MSLTHVSGAVASVQTFRSKHILSCHITEVTLGLVTCLLVYDIVFVGWFV